ncbi:hypothetical protein C0992_007516 [Termitomyces sp. T32_za158]|nr:hypothetical protein C0992_007516 [Termitomyces sp. T32_za158]
MLLPPTVRLPTIRRIASYPVNDLREALLYLRRLYNPQVQGSRRCQREVPSNADDKFTQIDGGLDELRSDTFERSYAMRWLTSLVSLTADWDSELTSDSSHSKEWESIVQEAASLLAVCSGSAGAGVIVRDFVFKLGSETEQTLKVQVKDLSLDNKDYGSVGAQTWGGACVLAETILDDPVSFGLSVTNELRILELGAGTGLVSLALGKLFECAGPLMSSRTIIATDYYP